MFRCRLVEQKCLRKMVGDGLTCPKGMKFKKWTIPGLFFIYFCLFKQTSLQFLQQINVKMCPSSIQCWDSIPRPLEHESPPITTRPGLLPKYYVLHSLYLSLYRSVRGSIPNPVDSSVECSS